MLCGLVVALGLGLSSPSLSQPIDQGENRQERAADARRSAARELQPASPPLSIEDSLSRIASEIEAANRGPEAERAEQRAEEDLDAQRDMARWAFAMFVATSVTVVIGFVGLALIWQTLVYTRKAAEHTGDMLSEARAASKTAADQLAHAQLTAERQLRAYMTINSAEPSDLVVGKHAVVTVIARNTGQTPAKSIQHNIYIDVVSTPPEDWRPPATKAAGAPSKTTKGQNSEYRMPIRTRRPISQQEHDGLLAGRLHIVVGGSLTYSDVFERTHETRFRFRARIEDGLCVMSNMPEGNDAD